MMRLPMQPSSWARVADAPIAEIPWVTPDWCYVPTYTERLNDHVAWVKGVRMREAECRLQCEVSAKVIDDALGKIGDSLRAEAQTPPPRKWWQLW